MQKQQQIQISKNSEDKTPMNLPSVPSHLEGKGLSNVDYGICKARQQLSIGNLLKHQEFNKNQFLDELGKTFMQVIGDIGIKTLPDKSAEQRMIHYVVNYYRDLTLNEIRKAFELAIVGELGIDIEHYNSFDIKYICKILNAYKIRRTIAQKSLAKAKPQETKKEMTTEEKEYYTKRMTNNICEQYEQFCKTGKLGMFPLSLVYDYLREIEILSVSEGEWNELQKMGAELYKKQLANPTTKNERKSFKSLLNDLEKGMNATHESRIKSIVKEIVIRKFYERCKAKKVDFLKLLTKSTSQQTKTSRKQTKST